MPLTSSALLRQLMHEDKFKAREPDLIVELNDESTQAAASQYFLAEKVKAQSMLEIGIECRRLEKRMFDEILFKYPQLKGVRFGVNYNEQTGLVAALVYDEKDEEEPCPTSPSK